MGDGGRGIKMTDQSNLRLSADHHFLCPSCELHKNKNELLVVALSVLFTTKAIKLKKLRLWVAYGRATFNCTNVVSGYN